MVFTGAFYMYILCIFLRSNMTVQLFDLFRRTNLFWSISILSPVLNKVSALYTFGHFS